jgi:hypothetical protein
VIARVVTVTKVPRKAVPFGQFERTGMGPTQIETLASSN